MKKFAGLLALILTALTFVGCDNKESQGQTESPVVLFQGAVELSDKKFGLYYGDKYGNEIGVYYVVLSDAMCFNNGYADPYMDSEGDMLVLEFNGELTGNESDLRLPLQFTTSSTAVASFTFTLLSSPALMQRVQARCSV